MELNENLANLNFPTLYSWWFRYLLKRIYPRAKWFFSKFWWVYLKYLIISRIYFSKPYHTQTVNKQPNKNIDITIVTFLKTQANASQGDVIRRFGRKQRNDSLMRNGFLFFVSVLIIYKNVVNLMLV